MNDWCAAVEDEWLVLRQDELPYPIFLLHILIFKRWAGCLVCPCHYKMACLINHETMHCNGKMTYDVFVMWFVLKKKQNDARSVCVWVWNIYEMLVSKVVRVLEEWQLGPVVHISILKHSSFSYHGVILICFLSLQIYFTQSLHILKLVFCWEVKDDWESIRKPRTSHIYIHS